jgi:sugar phosphate isomerase/epimerase
LLHVHDNKGHGDDHLPPGDGRIDWTTLLKELAAVNFSGAFILELAGGGDPEIIMARARRSRTYLRQRARRLALANHSSILGHG